MGMKSDSNTEVEKKVLNLAEGINKEIVTLRRKLHSYPELMFREQNTSEIIRKYLSGLNVSVREPYIGTDVTGVIKGRQEGKTVLLRADIDALNLEEKTGVPWQSSRQGYAHACGHDGHTAILLGAVTVLSALSENFDGNVKFVFQPAEEEGGGGKILVEKGLLDDEPAVDEVYALHGWPGIEEGCFEACPGAMMAAVDNFSIRVTGKGGHAAMPHLSVDPVLVSAHIITALQGIVSRNIDPKDTAVVSVCSVNGGELNNVIPDNVTLKGTVRYFRKEMQEFFMNRIENVTEGVCSSFGAGFDLKYTPSYIPLINTPEKTAFAGKVIESVFGERFWNGNADPTTGGEDFAFYLDRKPGVFYRLGLGLEYPSLHSSAFDFNDRVIGKGIVSMCAIALSSLGSYVS